MQTESHGVLRVYLQENFMYKHVNESTGTRGNGMSLLGFVFKRDDMNTNNRKYSP